MLVLCLILALFRYFIELDTHVQHQERASIEFIVVREDLIEENSNRINDHTKVALSLMSKSNTAMSTQRTMVCLYKP